MLSALHEVCECKISRRVFLRVVKRDYRQATRVRPLWLRRFSWWLIASVWGKTAFLEFGFLPGLGADHQVLLSPDRSLVYSKLNYSGIIYEVANYSTLLIIKTFNYALSNTSQRMSSLCIFDVEIYLYNMLPNFFFDFIFNPKGLFVKNTQCYIYCWHTNWAWTCGSRYWC